MVILNFCVFYCFFLLYLFSLKRCRAVKIYCVIHTGVTSGNLFGGGSSNVINFEIYMIPLFSYSRKLGSGRHCIPPPPKRPKLRPWLPGVTHILWLFCNGVQVLKKLKTVEKMHLLLRIFSALLKMGSGNINFNSFSRIKKKHTLLWKTVYWIRFSVWKHTFYIYIIFF